MVLHWSLTKSALYGYEGMGPYDRPGLLGGRNSASAYMGEDRAHNRYANYRSGPSGFHGGPPDWPGPGRTGFSDGPPVSNNVSGVSGRREGLMTYKQFIAELEDDILPAEAERRYEEYKTEFISTQKRAFFEQHKDDDWLREKYDPSQLEAVLARRIENAKAASKDFLAELQAGILDMGPNASGRGKAGANNDTGMSDEDADVSGKRRKSVKNSARDKEFDAAPKAPAITCEPKRISKDIEQVQALIRKLDLEKGIGPNILTSSEQQKLDADRSVSGSSLGPIVIVRGANQVKGLEGLELLDVMLSYLWRVHGLDYYGMIELKESPKGLRHVRTEGKTSEEMTTAAAAEWEKKLDSTWQSRLQSQDPVEAMLGREKLEAAAAEALDPLVRKIKDDKYGWKYGCGAKACSKLFHGPEYVHKHLKLKHPEIVNEVILKTREELYFQNYMHDPNSPGAGVMAASDVVQKDRGRKRRGLPGSSAGGPGSSADRPMPDRGFADLGPSGMGRGPLHDGDRLERGLVRHERLEKMSRDEEMFDRVDRSPGRDKGPPSSGPGPSYGGVSGPPEGGPMEPPMFDPFSGPAMRGPPFVSDLPPPPVLMPVPGAGPLGPFVPAPPEVAMRMWREQGGPPPFHPGAFDGGFDGESNGGSRGRRGRSSGHGIGPGMIDGPPMMMPVPPALRHDPRHVRSYHDLDAPEDEVTVIDYRSL
ncbi:hypothetical protein O6H91_09G000300 [Diphasiastrum complanatum]|uniref:Uncharacterized protein n=1 Tax=Diphasiastrum complanatum TaxID=34168 RepID=A0ACC2CKP3_DIPCM|nr:hypothetical protein O6H91_Y005400 [Diphasiastrum complanatum]KAJ7542554.1 hypothetical protein O6H91_09G000300 [Diphasiastrum complanatum]